MLAKLIAIPARLALLAGVGAFAGAGIVAVLRIPVPLVILAGIVLARRLQRRPPSGWEHGTARLADCNDLYRNGLIGGDRGLILGRAGFADPSARRKALLTLLFASPGKSGMACRLFLAAFCGGGWTRRSLIRLRKYVHLVTFAPTGRGKGISHLITNLLDHPGAVVVTDPQGSLARETAWFRHGVLGHRVVILDPFGLEIGGSPSDTFNPLDAIRADSPYLLDQARELANAMIVRTGEEHDPHFNDMAETVLTFYIGFVCVHETNRAKRNLQTVRDIVSSKDRYLKSIEAMKKSRACGGMLARMANQLEWLVDRELGSVLSSVQRHTTWMDSPAMAASLAHSSFDPGELKATGRMTIYLCLPPDKLLSHAAIMRVWVGGLLRAVATGGIDERHTVLFLLDEAGHIGHIQALENAVTLMRAYGVRLWFFFQSVGQLNECFGKKAGIFLDNIDTQLFFGINAIESAKIVAERIGMETITTESHQYGTSYSHPTGSGKHDQPGQSSTNNGVTVSRAGRQLFLPEEITRLAEDAQIIFHRNLPPILARLVKYFEAPEFRWPGVPTAQGLGLRGVLASGLVLAAGLIALVGAAAIPIYAPTSRPGVYGSDPSLGLEPDGIYRQPTYRYPSPAYPNQRRQYRPAPPSVVDLPIFPGWEGPAW